MKNIALLLLGLWLGAAIFFSGVVAPAAFAVLRSFQISNATEIAGAIVNQSLGVVNQTGFIVGLVVLTLAFLSRTSYGRVSSLLQLISLGTMVVLTALGQWVVAARMHALRLGLNVPIDQLARDDSRRLAFDKLHQYSVSALAAAMIAALLAAIFMMRKQRTNY